MSDRASSRPASEDDVIEHETGHAAGLGYLGFGPDTITIKPDHGEQSGSTSHRTALDDMPRYHRIVALLTGFRAERADFSTDLEGRADVKNARRFAREYLGAESDHSPEVTALIGTAWSDAGEILERTTTFRDAVRARLNNHRPYDDKKTIEVGDLWDDAVGYRVSFAVPRGKHRAATLMLDDEAVGQVTYAVEEGTGGVARLVLAQVDTPQEHRRRGHAQRLVIAVRDNEPGAILVDSPLENTEDGKLLLTAMRRHNTIHQYDCLRDGRPCECD